MQKPWTARPAERHRMTNGPPPRMDCLPKACCYGAWGVLLAPKMHPIGSSPLPPLAPLKDLDALTVSRATTCQHANNHVGRVSLNECSDPRGIDFSVAHQPQTPRSTQSRCRRHRASRIPVPRQSRIHPETSSSLQGPDSLQYCLSSNRVLDGNWPCQAHDCIESPSQSQSLSCQVSRPVESAGTASTHRADR